MSKGAIIEEYISSFRDRLNQLDFSTIHSYEDFRKAYGALLKQKHKELRKLGLPGAVRVACVGSLQQAHLTGSHRWYLWFKAEGVCGLCRERIATFEEATIDHINPYSLSRDNSLENKQIAHAACNNKKGNKIISSFAEAGVIL